MWFELDVRVAMVAMSSAELSGAVRVGCGRLEIFEAIFFLDSTRRQREEEVGGIRRLCVFLQSRSGPSDTRYNPALKLKSG